MSGGAVLKMEPPRYHFTNDWFQQSATIAIWDKIINSVKPTRILEVGCYEGRATTFLIERCARFGPLSMTCVDTWEGAVDLSSESMAGVEQRFDSNVAMACDWAPKVVLSKRKGLSSKVLPDLVARGVKFDFVYIDGSHTAPDVLADAIDAFRALRVDGAMIFDDYVWCMEEHGKEDSLNMPKPAIDAFVNIYARKLQLVHMAGQLSLVKTHD